MVAITPKICRRFSNAIKHYGIDTFDFDIICIASDQETLDALEICYIQVLGTLHPNGYNLKGGGDGGKHSPETRQKMSDNNARKGKPGTRLGKRLSPETRKKMSV